MSTFGVPIYRPPRWVAAVVIAAVVAGVAFGLWVFAALT